MGGQGRCYEVWKDMVECRTSYATTAPEQSHCKDLLSDYRECLHHTKELARIEKIASVAAKQQKQLPTIMETLGRPETQ